MLSSEVRHPDPRRVVDGSVAPNVPPNGFLPSAKRVRVIRAGETIVDTTRSLLVWEHAYYPRYYFPADEVSVDCHDTEGIGPIAGHVALVWDDMDAWFEEDEEVIVHARSPFTRVDALQSSRTVRVELDGVVVAESSNPVVLFETGLPARYYLPLSDVRSEMLTPTDLETSCPYKGTSRYWSIGEHENVVWSYPEPLPESEPVRDLLCFYNERCDLFVDGEPIDKPLTPFS